MTTKKWKRNEEKILLRERCTHGCLDPKRYLPSNKWQEVTREEEKNSTVGFVSKSLTHFAQVFFLNLILGSFWRLLLSCLHPSWSLSHSQCLLIGRLDSLVSSNISLLLVSLSSYSVLFLLLLLFFEGCSVVSEIHSDIFFHFARVSLATRRRWS
jgi:hypothetical protein